MLMGAAELVKSNPTTFSVASLCASFAVSLAVTSFFAAAEGLGGR